MKNVPFYREFYGDHGVTVRDLGDPDILERLPVVTKSDLLAAPAVSRRNTRFRETQLALEATTGSTGQPFSMLMDGAYRRRRNIRFLRALLATGYRPWQRLMLLTDRHQASLVRVANRFYVSVEQPTDAILEAYLQISPAVLYGFATPLRLLADQIQARGITREPPKHVISTAEMLDPVTASALRETFHCPLHDFYGLTEMGLVAWRPDNAACYHGFPDAVLTEFVPATGDDKYRLVMTNLDLHASPIIRFDSGDLASVGVFGGIPRITLLEGRRIDTLSHRNGSKVSPYRITDALRDVPFVRRFKVTERKPGDLVVDLELERPAIESTAQHVECLLRSLLGTDTLVEFRFHDMLVTAGTRKFRPVESLVSHA